MVYGDDLVVGGMFESAGGVPHTHGIALWDGSEWRSLGGGVSDGRIDSMVHSLTSYKNELIVAGDFYAVGDDVSAYWARWGCPAPTFATGDLNCDGAVDTADIDAFVLALVDPAGYTALLPDCDAMLADCNGDGAVDSADIDAVVQLLVGR